MLKLPSVAQCLCLRDEMGKIHGGRGGGGGGVRMFLLRAQAPWCLFFMLACHCILVS